MHVAKLCLKSPKTTSIYRRRGGASLGAQGSPKGAVREEEVDSHPNSVWGKESTPSFPPPSFLFFPLVFSPCGAIAHLGWPHQPTKGWCATLGLLGSLPGGWAPPGENPEPIRHSRYTTGNARNLSGDQMKPSYISIFVSGPFRKPS